MKILKLLLVTALLFVFAGTKAQSQIGIFESHTDIGKHPQIGKKTEMADVRVKIIKEYALTYRENNTTIEILTI